MSRAIPRIVVTGGPGGGKTTLMQELRAEDPRCERWILVPEAAPLLFQAGLKSGERTFQLAVVRLQITLEAAWADAARPGQILLCHRGTLDPLAYWLRNGWAKDEFFELTEMTYNQHLCRYNVVIHLQTAAVGAQAAYRRWPEAHRPETPEQAARIDCLCAEAWSLHPSYIFIANEGLDWTAKAGTAERLLARFLRVAEQHR